MKKKKSTKSTSPRKPLKKVQKKVAKKVVKKTVKKAVKKPIKKTAKKNLKTPRRSPLKAIHAGVEVGSNVPDFKVMSSSGAEFILSAMKGRRVVLYFYPKDDTPGCTVEGNDFNRLLEEFKSLNAVVYGISRDTVSSHCKFIGKFGFNFELLSDSDEVMCKLFDVIKEKNMYGNITLGIERSTFIIDENQKLIAEFRKVSSAGHAEAMLSYLKSR